MWPFNRKTEQRDWASTWLSFGDLLQTPTASGIQVTQATSIEHPAVYRCVDLNAQTIGSLPVDCLVRRGGERLAYPEPAWFKKPNDYQDFNGLVAEAQASQELFDSAFLLKAVLGTNVVGLSVLDPLAVQMTRIELDGQQRIVYDVQLVSGRVRLASTEILHIKAGLPIPGALRGVSPTVAARETIGTGLAARQFGANFFGTGATLSGVIEIPGAMNAEQAERLQEAFKKKHGGVSKSHAIGILTGGAQWKPMSVSPNESQHLETQKYTDATIAALFGIPAEYVSPGGMEGAKGYVTGLYQRQMLWYQTGLFPRITRNERAFSSLLPRPAYIKFNVNGWLRMDPEQRVAFYTAGQLGEWLTINEIRALEDMNPLEGGDEPLHSVQWQENAPEPEPEPEPELVPVPVAPPEEEE
jgi:HK97 family phage portal protein